MTMMDAEKRTRDTKRLLMIGASFLLGGLRMTCGSTGSTPSDWLGGPMYGNGQNESHISQTKTKHEPSMRMLMKRICIAFKGLLRPKKVLRVISVSAAHAVLSWNDRKF